MTAGADAPSSPRAAGGANGARSNMFEGEKMANLCAKSELRGNAMLLIQEGLAPIGQHKGPSKNRPKPVSNRLCFQSLEIPEKEGSKGKSTPAEGPPAPTARPVSPRRACLNSAIQDGCIALRSDSLAQAVTSVISHRCHCHRHLVFSRLRG